MEPEGFRRVSEVFAAASEAPEEERPGLLDRLCGDDPELRREVEELLEADRRSAAFLEQPAARVAEALDGGEPDHEPGHRIGPYRILSTLHHGGMGSVYLATRDDDSFRRRVALKVIRRGLAGDEIVRRFRNERQILAQLEHPNIARLYDGGTTEDGAPYLVMEVVRGLPLTEHCDRQRLPLDRRLALFRQVCSAVARAHRSLLVHRDIKPANILVGDDGVPKLLDFGIAKPLAGAPALETGMTRGAGGQPMTLAYASPEQVRGGPLTTGSDVYSLGVVLYELLAGCSPYRDAGRLAHELARAVCELEPERPSVAVARLAATPEGEAAARARSLSPPELRRRLRGDLDTIVLKALRKEPERRYASADEISREIGRHLESRPVQARPDSLLYRSGKFLRRHRTGLAAAAAVLLVAAVLGAAVARQAERADRERRRAREVASGLVDMLLVDRPGDGEAHPAGPPEEEPLATAGALLVRRLGDRPEALAVALDTLGQVHYRAGDAAAARRLFGEALAAHRAHPDPDPRELAVTLHNLGVVTARQGDPGAAVSLFHEALATARAAPDVPDQAYAETETALGLALARLGRFSEAEERLRRSLQLRRRSQGPESLAVADGLTDLASLLREAGRPAEAGPLHEEALAIRRRLLGPSHPEVAASVADLADLRFVKGEYRAAAELYREALARWRQSSGGGLQVALAIADLARCLGEAGDYEEAKALFRESLAVRAAAGEADELETATLLNNLAVVLSHKGEDAAAEALFLQVVEIRLSILGEDHPHVAQARYSLGRLLHDRGDLDGAEALYLQAGTALDQALPVGHRARAYPRVAQARLLLDRGRPEEAEALLRPALVILKAGHPAGHWRIAHAEGLLGASLAARGRLEEAEPLLARAYATLTAQRSHRDPRTRRAAARLADLYRATGRPEEARELEAAAVTAEGAGLPTREATGT